jgi:predicted nuclease of predicted toxin-antitoxin system
MRILLDHNLDWRLWELLQPHEVVTTKRMGWDRYGNGELLDVAQAEFDVLLTTDTNLYHQQKVADYDLAVIVLRAYQNSMEALAPLMGQVMDLLERTQPGEIYYVYVDERLRQTDMRRGRGPYAKNQQPSA